MKLALLALACMLACTDNGNSTIGVSGNVNVSGTWAYSTSNVQGNPITCSSSGTVLTLTQQGTTVSGNFSGGTLTCSGGGAPPSTALGSGTIAAGTASGSTVAFDLGGNYWHNTGTAAGTSMSGAVTLSVALNNMNYTLTGTWVATKQ
jgi:hypothetical protein